MANGWSPRIEATAQMMRDESLGVGLPNDVRKVFKAAGEEYGVSIRAILSTSRRAEIVAARKQVAIHLRGTGMSFPRIARILRLEHHSSVMYYLRTCPKARPQPKRSTNAGEFLASFTGLDESGIWAI